MLTVTETNTWCLWEQEDCPQSQVGDSVVPVEGKRNQGLLPVNQILCSIFMARGKSRLGKTDLFWKLPCLVSPMCELCQRKGKKPNTFSLLFLCIILLCMTYCSLEDIEKTLVKIKCTFLKFILAQFCLHQKFKKSWEMVLHVTASSLWVDVKEYVYL